MLGRDDPLFVHLVRRVLGDKQWTVGTTAEQYVADPRRTVRAADPRLAVYARRGGYVAATLTPTDRAVPAERRGPTSLPDLLVVYSADRGAMLTGYQVAGPQTVAILKDARWLT